MHTPRRLRRRLGRLGRLRRLRRLGRSASGCAVSGRQIVMRTTGDHRWHGEAAVLQLPRAEGAKGGPGGAGSTWGM